ncbi:MAG: hypothetical protein IPN15_16580, partial [Saprospiraceae bacterium]|nr:hypothetical protein [Candidatus Vicinibacter affinis]
MKYLRIRLTTNNLQDDATTTQVDERSYFSASNGEVEDYRCVQLTCPLPDTVETCLLTDTLNAKFNAWLAKASGGGGCDGTLSNNNT